MSDLPLAKHFNLSFDDDGNDRLVMEWQGIDGAQIATLIKTLYRGQSVDTVKPARY
jgi:hypothetical protein